MAKAPDKPKRPKDPARPTRAKAAREHVPALAPELERLLNPAIGQGAAGIGSGTGLQPPPDNSRERRAEAAAQHKARASTAQGFSEAPQTGYVGKIPVNLGPLDPDLARAWGITDEDEGPVPSPRLRGEG
ncbi:MAG TPA: excinuclease ABC subunit UvrB, partial [Xanthobacteraceae bacterium]